VFAENELFEKSVSMVNGSSIHLLAAPLPRMRSILLAIRSLGCAQCCARPALVLSGHRPNTLPDYCLGTSTVQGPQNNESNGHQNRKKIITAKNKKADDFLS
jgi:hypothetical protein